MVFNYDNSVWGAFTASFKISDPTAWRLRQSFLVLPRQGKILELGCGAGQFVRAIKQKRPELNCVGLDISAPALEVAKQYNDGVEYVLGSGDTLPFGEGEFDAVLIYDVLEHVKDYKKVLSEVKRVLKPAGKFYFFVPCEGDWLSFWHLLKIFKPALNLTEKYAGHINYFSRAQIFSDLKELDFKIVKKSYSEHFLGQLVGLYTFFAMDKYARQNHKTQINNEEYFKNSNTPSWFKKFANSLIYIESKLLSFLPSPNLNIICQK